MESVSDDFIILCESSGFTKLQANLLRKLIGLNKGVVSPAMIRGNFAISYDQATELAKVIAQNGHAKYARRLPGMILLPPKERSYGWFGTRKG